MGCLTKTNNPFDFVTILVMALLCFGHSTEHPTEEIRNIINLTAYYANTYSQHDIRRITSTEVEGFVTIAMLIPSLY
jgi:hypothetical protein